MIHFIEQGNIFTIDGVTSYAHGCNCAGAMGKGIALQFRRMFPRMYAEYQRMCRAGEFRPGDVFAFQYETGKYVFNLATQQHYLRQYGQLARLEWIRESVDKMLALAEEYGVTDIAMPAIGSGLGGLRWPDVHATLEAVVADSRVTLHVVENYNPNK